MHNNFGERRIYYNNFAPHLLNAYNPNMYYPELPNRWSDDDWRSCVDMVASLGFNVFEFWLAPRMLCGEVFESPAGLEFTRQIDIICEHAHKRNLAVECLCSLATVGENWHTLCPNDPAEWNELRTCWDRWTRRLSGVDVVGIFPGDPGACSRNGCTAETFIDKTCEIAELVRQNLPKAEITLHTWGPPFFGWGLIRGPEGWTGEFVQEWQETAWTFDKGRMDRSMEHLVKRLPEFPDSTRVAINLGFGPDGNPDGDQDARPWAREIAKTHRIETWDFSLTEGENNVVPHFRFQRLLEQRRRERDAAPYSGGICFTMSPKLNQLSLWESAQSFIDPDADPDKLAATFYERLFGTEGRQIVPYLPLFEVVADWGNYVAMNPGEAGYHKRLLELRDLLVALESEVAQSEFLYPGPDSHRRELLFFAQFFADLSAPGPDYDALASQYWHRVYGIYDHLGEHVDPRPREAVRTLIEVFHGSGNA